MSTVEFFDAAINSLETTSEELHQIILDDTKQELKTTVVSDTNSPDAIASEILPAVELIENNSLEILGETNTIYLDEQTGFTSGIRYTEGPRVGQEYFFNRDAIGNVTDMTIRLNNAEDETVQEIKLSKKEDHSWQIEPPETRQDIPEFQNLQFIDGENNSVSLKGEINVLEDGTIQYDRGDGIEEVLRPNGGRDVFDMNEYSRVREVNGQSEKLYWDGYEWRAGEKDQSNPNTVIFNPPVDGKPIRIERNSELDTFKVEFGDGLTYDANWKNQKITRTGANLPEVSLYPSSHVNSFGKPIWMAGEKIKSSDGSLRIEFKPSNEEELSRMQNGELPVEAIVPHDSDKVTVRYTNGTEITSSRKGEVSKIEHYNGQTVQLTRDISGRVIKIEGIGNTIYERKSAIGPDGQKTTQWTASENGKPIDRLDGEVEVGPTGNLVLKSPDGDKINLYNGERIITIDDGKELDIPLDTEVPQGEILPFPPRSNGPHLTGSKFFQDILGVNPAGGKYQNGLIGFNREQAILKQIEAGNIPDFLRHPKKVTVQDNQGNTALLSVMPDYLAIGTNEDWLRVPVTPILARAIADRYGLVLPTRKIVDTIYDQAEVKVPAVGLVNSKTDSSYMQGNGFYLEHNQIIEDSLSDIANGALVAGQKKDIIVSQYAETNPDKLDFYGFFDGNGKPIQNSGGGPHNNIYVDYSHGARFIAQTIMVNGQPMLYRDVLKDPQLAGLLSDNGRVNIDSIYRDPVQTQYQTLFK